MLSVRQLTLFAIGTVLLGQTVAAMNENYPEEGFVQATPKVERPTPTRQPKPKKTRQTANYVNPLDGRQFHIQAGPRGHFIADARFNGSHVEVLVDTGATLVAINRSTARRIGIRLKDSDFTGITQTANGQARYARAKIGEIQMGRIVVRDVEAAVLSDRSLNSILLGTSFLSKLREFKVKNNTMMLIQ